MSTQKFVTIENQTLTQVPGISPKARENLRGKRDRPDQAHRSGAGLYPDRIHLPIDWVGISPRWTGVVQDALLRYI